MPHKYDPHSGPSQKVIGMFSMFLFSGRAHSLTQLSTTFRCSKQTILRMLEQIQRSRWLTIDEWTEGREKFYQARKSTRMPNITLDAEALGKLFLCRDMVWHMLPDSYRREVSRALQGASSLLPEFSEDPIMPASYTQAKPKGMIDYTGKETLITDLIRAIREHKICDVHYAGPKHARPKTYTVAPYQVVLFHEGLYLRCRPAPLVPESDASKDMILAIHRMRRVALREERFGPIKMKQDAQQLAGTFGLTQGESFRARVKVSPGAALYVKERIWSDDQKISRKADGSLILEFSTTSEPETIAWVLSFGGEMELLKPESLREKTLAAANRIARFHRTPKTTPKP